MMSPNRRIALNVIATYGRSLYAMACGLFSSRWALMSLGQTDYGLYGVVGGLTVFMCFLNGLMSSAISRFYAFSVGEAKKEGNEAAGLDNCRRWFNVSFAVHMVLPSLLVAVGYPIGVWAVEHFLTIPPDRINACLWVWRFTCISAWVGMGNAPFMAMYNAKQEIAELTLFGVMTTTANIVILYYMVGHPGDWLATYGFWMCAINVIPQILIVARAVMLYPECKIIPRYFWDWQRLKQLIIYAGARAFAISSQIFSLQGVAVVVNKWLGATRNATMTIGNTIANQCSSLAGSFSGALYPAITNAVGEGRYEYARKLTYRTCLLAAVSFLLFVLPLSVELDGIVGLWLQEPPIKIIPVALLMLTAFTLDRLTEGHWMLILSHGKIVRFQIAEASANFITIIAVIVLLCCGMDVEAVGWGMVVAKIAGMGVKLCFCRRLCQLSIRYWARHIAAPLVAVSAITLAAGVPIVHTFDFTIWRVVLTTCVMEMVFLPCVWLFVFDDEDRDPIRLKIRNLGARFLKRRKAHG